ncbi:MAG: hypothetical protein KKH49_03760, partial [Candidatus Omnitrophica bacterium]|nr:hypothetical protein [Candidatus Omnitrophota bacterium]
MDTQLFDIKSFLLTYSILIAPLITGLGGALLGAYITFRFERYKRIKGWYVIYLAPIEKLVDRILDTCSKAIMNLSVKALPDLTKPIFDLLVDLLVATPYMYKTGDKKLSKLVGRFRFDTFAVLKAIDEFLFENNFITKELFEQREVFFKGFKLSLEPKLCAYFDRQAKKTLKTLNNDYKKYRNEKIGFSKVINKNM